AMQLNEPPHRNNFAALCSGVFRDQGYLAVVVDKTTAREPLMGYALAKLHQVEVAVVDALIRQGLVETHHHWLILRADRPDQNTRAACESPGLHILQGIGPDGSPWQSTIGNFGRVQDHACVQCDQLLSGGEYGINVDLLDPGMFSDQLTEPYNELFEC